MSAYNEGAILQGLNNSVVDMWKFGMQQSRLDRQEQRQAELDKQNAEAHALNMRASQMRVDEADREIKERQGARQAATPQKAQDGFAVGNAGSQNFYKDEATARAAAEDQAFIDGSEAPQAPRQATGITGGGKPQIGAFGMKVDNSREAVAKRVADYWRSLGETDKADQIEMQAKETSRKFYDAAREEIWRNALEAGKNGPQAFVDALYKNYNDGFDARVVPGPNGGGRVERIGKDGKPNGYIDFANMDDLASKAYQLVFPDRAFEAGVKSRAEIAKERAKGVKLAPGEQQYVYDGQGNLVPAASNDNKSSAEKAALIRAAGASGVGSSKNGKTVGPSDPYMSAIDDAIKTSEVKFSSPDEAVAVRTIAETFASNAGYDTKKLPPNVALQVAMNYMRAGGKKAETVGINPETGVPRREYNDPDYKTFDLGPATLTPDQMKNLAPKMLERQGFDASGRPISRMVKGANGSIEQVETTAKDAAEYQKKMRSAAFDDGARKALEADIKSQVELSAEQAISKYPDREAQIRASIPARLQQEMQVLDRKLRVISAGMKPEKKDEEQSTRSAKDILSSGGIGLPRGLAAESLRVANEKDAKSAENSKRLEQESADARAKAERNKKLREEAAAIQPEAILRSTNLDELRAVQRDYDPFMSAAQREALYRRISVLRRQKEMSQFSNQR